MAKVMRAALYLRVSRDSQTTENQRIVLTTLAAHREFQVVKEYEDQGISGGKGRDRRPAFDQMLKDAVRRRFDALLISSMDRLGRSVQHVAQAMAELDAVGVALISKQQGAWMAPALAGGHDRQHRDRRGRIAVRSRPSNNRN